MNKINETNTKKNTLTPRQVARLFSKALYAGAFDTATITMRMRGGITRTEARVIDRFIAIEVASRRACGLKS